jgi:hypothetical protein
MNVHWERVTAQARILDWIFRMQAACDEHVATSLGLVQRRSSVLDFNSFFPGTLPGFEPRTPFLECRSKGIGSPSQFLTYEITDQKSGSEGKQRNVPVWAILGQYSAGVFQPK